MAFITNFLSSLASTFGSVVTAAIILLVAFIAAGIAKSLVLKLIEKTKLNDMLAKVEPAVSGKPGSAKDFIAKLVYLLVFLLFVPGIFSALGMSSVVSPITNLLNTIWGYVPNILAAAIVLVIGTIIARIVRQLLVPVFDKLNVNKLQEKAGIEVANADKLSYTLAYIVYVLILIPTVIMALDVLDIHVISDPAMGMLNTLIGCIPNIIIALVLIVIGCMIGKFAGQLVSKLIGAAGLDAKLQALIDSDKVVLSKAVGAVVNAVIVIFFVVEGLNELGLGVLSQVGAVIIGYMPAALAAVLILAACMIFSAMAEKALRKNGFDTYAVIAKCAIITIGAFMILSQLGIASEIVNSAFILIMAALAVAFAVAFGIGGKEFAANVLKKLENSAEEETKAEK